MEPIVKFFGNSDLLQPMNNNRPKKWLTENLMSMIRQNFSTGKTHCIIKVSFEKKVGKIDIYGDASMSLVEIGESSIVKEELENHLLSLSEKEKIDENREFLVFYGILIESFKTKIKRIQSAQIIAAEEAVVRNLPPEFRK